jgi:hypothetical protein
MPPLWDGWGTVGLACRTLSSMSNVRLCTVRCPMNLTKRPNDPLWNLFPVWPMVCVGQVHLTLDIRQLTSDIENSDPRV